MTSQNRILLVGGEGVIGTEIQRSSNRCEDYLSADICEREGNRKFSEFVFMDVRDEEACFNVLSQSRPRGIVHLAAIARVAEAELDKEQCIKTNLGGTENLVSALHRVGITPWVVFSSSREVYGETTQPVVESMPKNPINVYGRTKLESELIWFKYGNRSGVNVFVMRLSNVYGSIFDKIGRVVPAFTHSILSGRSVVIEGGEQAIDFTFIDDVVAIVQRIETLLDKTTPQKSFQAHIAPGKSHSLQELIHIIENLTGRIAQCTIAEARSYDVIRFEAINTQITQLVNYQSFVSLVEGMRRYLRRVQESDESFSWKQESLEIVGTAL